MFCHGLPPLPPLRASGQRRARGQSGHHPHPARHGAPASKSKDAGKADAPAPAKPARNCPCRGGRMLIVETFQGSCRRRGRHLLPLGTTRHEQDRARLHPNRWQPPPPLSGRLRRRLPGSISFAPVLGSAMRPRAGACPWLNSPLPPSPALSSHAPDASCCLPRADGRGEILIALCSTGALLPAVPSPGLSVPAKRLW